MAYEAMNQDDEQKQQVGFGNQAVNQNTQAENNPTLGGQQSNMVQGVAGQQAQQVQGGQSNTSTGQKNSGMGARLSNLKKYVEGNRNSGMAQGIQKGIEGIRTGLQGNINTAQTKLQGQTAEERARIARGQTLVKGSAEGGLGVLEKGRSEQYTGVAPQPVQEAPVQPAPSEGIIQAKREIPQSFKTDYRINIPKENIDKSVGTLRGQVTNNQAFADGGSIAKFNETQNKMDDNLNQPITEQPVQQAPDFSQYGQTAADRLAEFSKYRKGEASQYDIENQFDLENQAKELQKQADLGNTEAGRYQLLRDTFKRPSYTTGQQRLDQLIIQADPNAVKLLQDTSANVLNPVNQQMQELQKIKELENANILTDAGALSGRIKEKLYGQEIPVEGQQDVGVINQFNQDLSKKQEDLSNLIGKNYTNIMQKINNGEPLTAEETKQFNQVQDSGQADILSKYNAGVKKTAAEQLNEGKGFDPTTLEKIAIETGMDANRIQNDLTAKFSSKDWTAKQGFYLNSNNNLTGDYQHDIEQLTEPVMGEVGQDEQGRPIIGVVGRTPKYIQGFANWAQGTPGVGNSRDLGMLQRALPIIYKAMEKDKIKMEQRRQTMKENINKAFEKMPELSKYRNKNDINYTPFIDQTPDLSIGKIATQDDYLRQEALRQLSDERFGDLNMEEIANAGAINADTVKKYSILDQLRKAQDEDARQKRLAYK